MVLGRMMGVAGLEYDGDNSFSFYEVTLISLRIVLRGLLGFLERSSGIYMATGGRTDVYANISIEYLYRKQIKRSEIYFPRKRTHVLSFIKIGSFVIASTFIFYIYKTRF